MTKLMVSASPHLRNNSSTRKIMKDVIIALMPAAAAGVYYFGIRAAIIILTTVITCVLFEYITAIILKRENTIDDLSAIVTGLLLGMNLPVTIHPLIAVLGSLVAIVIIKQIFGGIGQNFINPALGARVFLTVSFAKPMTDWIAPLDGVTSATPLAVNAQALSPIKYEYIDMFFGKIPGCIGETSVLALLIGAIYLIIRKVISLEIPLSFIGTAALFAWIFGGTGAFSGDPLYHILAGGLMIGAFLWQPIMLLHL